MPRASSACRAARATGAGRRRVERGDHDAAGAPWPAAAAAPSAAERFRIELQRPFWRRDRAPQPRCWRELAERLGVPCVATGNVHAHIAERAPLQDAFVAVRLRSHARRDRARSGAATRSHVLAPPEAMARALPRAPGAVAETARLAERLEFDLTRDLGYRYPGSEDPAADRKLAELCRARHRRPLRRARATQARPRAARRGAAGDPARSGLSGFFLLHRDLLELAREVAVEVRGRDSARALLPPGRGRGSSV